MAGNGCGGLGWAARLALECLMPLGMSGKARRRSGRRAHSLHPLPTAFIKAMSESGSPTSQEDEVAQSLEDCLSVFRSGLHQDFRTEDLVFCTADTQTPPPLQSLAVANAQFLEYRDWVTKLYMDTDSLDCGPFERCKAIRGQLLDDLRNECARLDELELQAWQAQARQNSLSVQVVDTCES